MNSAHILANGQKFCPVKKNCLTPTTFCSILLKSHNNMTGGSGMETGKLIAENAVNGLKKREYKGMLYDFYGDLLTQHQKKLYEDAIFNDLSLSEIADEQGISRQGVHDLIRRCDKILVEYETKLHLVEKFSKIKQNIQQINQLTEDEQIKRLSNEIMEEL